MQLTDPRQRRVLCTQLLYCVISWNLCVHTLRDIQIMKLFIVLVCLCVAFSAANMDLHVLTNADKYGAYCLDGGKWIMVSSMLNISLCRQSRSFLDKGVSHRKHKMDCYVWGRRLVLRRSRLCWTRVHWYWFFRLDGFLCVRWWNHVRQSFWRCGKLTLFRGQHSQPKFLWLESRTASILWWC